MPLGVTAAGSVSTQLLFASNSVFPSVTNASYIGGLAEDTTDLSVSSQLSANVSSNIFKFNFEKGSSIKLNFTNQTNSTNLRVQLYDVTGKLVADSGGTVSQVIAFNNLNSSSGLSAANGTYYVRVSYASGASTDDQSYNFQLYSGTTYTNSIVTSAQTQSYDPNLFISATSSVSASSSALAYSKTATLPAIGSSSKALDIGNLISNQTSLYAAGTITTANATDYYSFNFTKGSTIKLAIDNTTNSLNAVSLRAQLLDSKGNVVADNEGNEAQRNAYRQLVSGAGLPAANGKYTVVVSPTPGEAYTANQTYDLQFYSGNTYTSEYETTAVLPTSGAVDSVGSNVGVYAASTTSKYKRTAYNTIGAKATSAVNIGWLAENQSALAVQSQLSSADSTDYYSFTLQKGSALKFAYSDDVNNSSGKQQVRIQLLDATGTHVFADSAGTDAQKKAYAQLTSSSGLKVQDQSDYVVKVTYADGADKTKSPIYNFSLYSGTQYSALYKTYASAQTYQNAILTGNTAVISNSASLALTNFISGSDSSSSVFDTLSTYA